ncbi:MAG: polysaccharide biosynthesis protein [Oscillospiraceae bacterium]|jgi:stage V sporulation protein B|nr:polysaccharide biosynthesis protein [Oscillospiraceae bacterium]
MGTDTINIKNFCIKIIKLFVNIIYAKQKIRRINIIMNKCNKQVTQSFAKGTIIIMLAMLITKILGAVFKIPLVAILGAEGYGYFNSAYNLYNPIYALSTVGLPLAVSKMVSEKMVENKFKDIEKIRKLSTYIFIFTGIFGTTLMMICAYPFAKFTNSPNVIYSIFLLAPTVLFVCLMSIYKGYYQGMRNMIPTAVSEVVEAIGKVVFGLALAYFTLNKANNEFLRHKTVFGFHPSSPEMAKSLIVAFGAAGAILGITIAAFFGYLYMYIKHLKLKKIIPEYKIEKSPETLSTKIIIKDLLKLAIPIGLGAIITNLSGAIDSIIIQNRLNHIANVSPLILINCFSGLIPQDNINNGTVHVFLWGCFGTMTTITMLIPTFLQGISINALPMMTEILIKKNRLKIKKAVESIFKITVLIAMPCGMGLAALSCPILNLIYGSKNESYIASQIIILAGIAIIFVSISTSLCSILQAAGRPDIPLKILAVGLLAKTILNYILISIPEINIHGANISTLICYFFICSVLIYQIHTITHITINLFSILFKPAFCSICCAIAAYTSYNFISQLIAPKIATLTSISLAGIIYLISLFVTKTIDKNDLEVFPFKKKFSRFSCIFGILKK